LTFKMLKRYFFLVAIKIFTILETHKKNYDTSIAREGQCMKTF
jgi:hypothetical protein